MQFLNQAGDISGEGLGTLLRVLDIATAAKRGNVGGALARQALLTTDPSSREAVSQSPLLAGFTGAYGNRQPTAEVAQAGGPIPGVSILGPGQQPGTPQSQFQANLPPQSSLAQLEELAKRYNIAHIIAQIPLIDAQARNQGALAGLTQRYLAGGGTEGGGGLGLRQIGPAGATFAPPTGVDLPSGTIGPGGTVVTPGQALPGNRTVSTLRPEKKPEQKPAPQALVNAVTQGNAMLASLDNVLAISEKAGVSNVQGPLAGRVAANVTNPWGFTSPDQASFLNALEQMFNTYRLATTGQQASYQELERISKALPNANIDPQTFTANAREVAKTTVRQILAKTQGAEDIGRSIPGIQIPDRIAKLIAESGPTTTAPTTPGGTTTTTLAPPSTGTSITPEAANYSVDWINNGGKAPGADLTRKRR